MEVPESYKSLTQIASQYNKQLVSWANRKVGKDAISKFKFNYPDIEYPVIVIKGRSANRGTWAHPELAIKFKQWCDPETVRALLNQNAELKEQNALLKEKIRTFQVDTPAQIAAVQDEIEEIKRMAYHSKDKGEEEIELIAKCHFARATNAHPKGMTFKQYLPHWLFSQGHRTDIYPAAVLEAMTAKSGKPIPLRGMVLKKGYSCVWEPTK